MDDHQVQALLQLRARYATVVTHLRVAVEHNRGEQPRLRTVHQEGMRFLDDLIAIWHLVPEEEAEAEAAEETVETLLDAVEEAYDEEDRAVHAHPDLGSWEGTGGRPRFEISKAFLEVALKYCKLTDLAHYLGVSRRTLRRRALDYGLSIEGRPVIIEHEGPDGPERFQVPRLSRCTWTDEELLEQVRAALERFPRLGRPMLLGLFLSQGVVIPQQRMRAALVELTQNRRMGNRYVHERRTYSVAGPNSLWHIDAQLGLIRYGLVIHGLIDGYSRLSPGLRVHTNNRAATFMVLFRKACAGYGTPSRVRGDHGLENLYIAAWMEAERGPDRGSFLWGKSIHNIRIERLWVDVTNGFGSKWKLLFVQLETWLDLDVNDDGHIWLLHFLFLDDINADADLWRQSWNAHKMELPDQPTASPNWLWMFGMMERGYRGLDDDELWQRAAEEGQQGMFGVDWQDLHDDRIMEHHFNDAPPRGVTVTDVQEPVCPLTVDEVNLLRQGLQGFRGKHDLRHYTERWERALDLYNGLLLGRL